MEDQSRTAARSFLTYLRTRQFLNTALVIGLLALSSVMAASSYSTRPAAAAPPPQATFTGDWTAEFPKDKTDKIYMKLERRTDSGNKSISGSDMLIAEFQGLTREQALSQKADVKFRLVREAGTFDFEGTFSAGRGSGTWTFTPSQTFLSEMRARGYDNLSEEKQFASAMIDVHVKTVDDLKAAGFDHLSFEDVIKATIFKITPQYIGELKSLGFENLELEELVKARIFKIDAEFARQVREMG